MRVRHSRAVTTWVDETSAARLRERATDTGTIVSAVIAGILGTADLGGVQPPPGRRRVTMATYLPRSLIDQVDEAAAAVGVTRSELIAGVVGEALSRHW